MATIDLASQGDRSGAPEDMTVASADGLALVGRCWRPKDEPRGVVCLVHGHGEHSGRYGHVAAALAMGGLATVALDLRGHGRSGGARGDAPSFDHLLDDVNVSLARAGDLFPGRPRFLYGHSLGGNLVLNYALRRASGADGTLAVAGVVATSPWLVLAQQPPAWKSALARVLGVMAPAVALRTGLAIEALSHDPAVIRAYQADPLVHDLLTSRLYLGIVEAGAWALAKAGEFPPVPLLIMHGGADRVTLAASSAEFAAHVPERCVYREWAGLAHETHNEPEREEVLAFIREWLVGQIER